MNQHSVSVSGAISGRMSHKRPETNIPPQHETGGCDNVESIEELKAKAKTLRKKPAKTLRKKPSHPSTSNRHHKREDPDSVDRLKQKARRLRSNTTSTKSLRNARTEKQTRPSRIIQEKNEADSMEQLKLKARRLRKRASDKKSLDEVDWVHDKSNKSDIDKLEAKARTLKRSDSETSLLLEEIFDADKGSAHLPESMPLEKRFSESLSSSLSSISRYFDSFASNKDDDNNTADKGSSTPVAAETRRMRSLLNTARIRSADQSKTNSLADEAESVASGSISSSIISRYFDSIANNNKDEDVLKIGDAPSVDGTEKRHLLLLGQKPSEKTKAEILLSDKKEWRKLQQRIRMSGMITNQGTRQILNPLLEKAKIHITQDDDKELPPFIMVPEPSDEASVGGHHRRKKR